MYETDESPDLDLEAQYEDRMSVFDEPDQEDVDEDIEFEECETCGEDATECDCEGDEEDDHS